jgi:TubC N-terminal docking domain
MTATDLVAYLTTQGFTLTSLPGDKLEVRPASKLTDPLRAAIRQHKAGILAALVRPPEQRVLWQQEKGVQTHPTAAPADAAYWTRRFDETMAAWKRKEYGPCVNCGHDDPYEWCGFRLCRICTPPPAETQQ